MRAVGGNALATNFERWTWGDQISMPKAKNVIAAVGVKYYLATKEVLKSGSHLPKNIVLLAWLKAL